MEIAWAQSYMWIRGLSPCGVEGVLSPKDKAPGHGLKGKAIPEADEVFVSRINFNGIFCISA